MNSSIGLQPETPVQYVKGIGPKRAQILASQGILTVDNLLHYYPRRYLDRTQVAKIRNLSSGQETTVVGTVLAVETIRGRKSRLVLSIGDGTGILQCVWFHGLPYVSQIFHRGETVAFSGKVTVYHGPQLIHPEYDKLSEEGEKDPLHTGGIIPLYPSTDGLKKVGLDGRGFRRVIASVLEGVRSSLAETLSSELIRRRGLDASENAVRNIHFPSDWEAFRKAEYRLKFEELFFIQLHLSLQRRQRIEEQGISFDRDGDLTKRFFGSLPFQLTGAQKRVIQVLREDMRSSRSMNRLLQGDVGSGKTVVAMAVILTAVENGYQAAFMVPTEILSDQHAETLQRWGADLSLRMALLNRGQKAGARREILEAVRTGQIDVVVGTHALVQKAVIFHRLGLVVIDEQHRFGVLQRAMLREKGWKPDVLVMTATPIPRTLALTLYGDLDLSVLDEMPPGRIPVRTFWRRSDRRNAVYEYLLKEAEEGRQAYVVYPLVEESEKSDLAAATEGSQELETRFPNLKIALLHGRMKTEEKTRIMSRFKEGSIQVLVSTTVIEVGVDVANASLMVVEHAERFGLTQLHQLRGRVGRGFKESTCVLISYGHLSDDAVTRLETMEKTTDGFQIAEADLKLRGPGELYGVRQHGELNLKIADLVADGPILEKACEDARSLIENDPKLADPGNLPIRKAYLKRYKERFGLIAVG